MRAPARIALWGAVGALVASAHVAAAAWAMRRHVEPLPAPPKAIEIELAAPEPAPPQDAPVAGAVPAPAQSEPSEAAPPPPEDAPQSPAPPDPAPAPDFALPQIEPLSPLDPATLAPPPAADFVPPPVVPLPPPDFASLAPPAPDRKPRPAPKAEPPRKAEPIRGEKKAEAPGPEKPQSERPRPDKPKPDQPRPEKPRADRPKAEQPQSDRPKADPPKAERGERGRVAGESRTAGAAPSGQARPAAGGASRGSARPAAEGGGRTAGAVQSWQASAGARITAHMRRTRLPGARGTFSVMLSVTVQPNGTTVARLVRGSGDARVDAALSRQAARLPRLPPPPDGRASTFNQPISIQMR